MSERNKKIVEKLNFLVAYLLIYYVFFGFICNLGTERYLKNPGDRLLYVSLNFFSNLGWNWAGLYPPTWMDWLSSIPGWISIFIFFLIGVLQAYREEFLFHAIRNSLTMIPLVIITSWIWYTINYSIPGVVTYIPLPGVPSEQLTNIPVNFFNVIARYFVVEGQFQWMSLINILLLSVIYIGAAFCGGVLKIYRSRRKIIAVVD